MCRCRENSLILEKIGDVGSIMQTAYNFRPIFTDLIFDRRLFSFTLAFLFFINFDLSCFCQHLGQLWFVTCGFWVSHLRRALKWASIAPNWHERARISRSLRLLFYFIYSLLHFYMDRLLDMNWFFLENGGDPFFVLLVLLKFVYFFFLAFLHQNSDAALLRLIYLGDRFMLQNRSDLAVNHF